MQAMLTRIFRILFTLVLIYPSTLQAAEPPTDPILRIESDMHTATLRSMAVDAANRFLVTASLDKTVRVWDLPTGQLLKILRVPVGGDAREGKLEAVAISPDGKTIACGGWTQFNEGKSNVATDGINIYLFDRETGALTNRLAGLPNVILHLAYSKDGRFLVATLGMKNGIRLYRTSDYRLVGEDKDYGDTSYGADFSPDAAPLLAITSWDGYIRLYEVSDQDIQALRLIAKENGRGGKQPVTIKFSPSSSSAGLITTRYFRNIAVGYEDTRKVDVYAAGTSGNDRLAYRYSPDTTGVSNGNLMRVGWSADGRNLYAGGMYGINNVRQLRKWDREGSGAYQDIPSGAGNTIVGILPLSDGRVAFGAADPAFGIIDGNGKQVYLKQPSIADYRNIQQGFLISPDGGEVQFGYEAFGKSPARFAVTEGTLTAPGEGKTVDLAPPLLEASGLQITDWRNTHTPKLNGTVLPLSKSERSLSRAVAYNGERFILGTGFALRLFDRRGRERWKVPVPGSAWGVNIADDGKTTAATLGDGTIRWYRMTDGKELLAFFPHNDRKRWVIWTPAGYYNCSPGAEELIGWHVNNGKDQAADFYPVSRFRNTYYRPDVIARVIKTGDEKEAIRIADTEAGRKGQDVNVQQILPPVAMIQAPTDNAQVSAREITLKYSIRSPSGEPVTGIKVLLDGRPIQQERGVQITPKGTDVREMRIAIPERDSEISLIAENKYAVSEPATIRLRWAGKINKDEFVVKPKLYVLSIGVSKYQDKDLTLGYAAKDAQDFAAAMQRQKGDLYREVAVKVLTDEKATRDEIMDCLDWLQKETTAKDVGMLFIAGHGVNDPTGIYYYLPANADTEKLKRTGIAFSDIKNTIASLAGKTLLFVDTCHAGNVMGKRRGATDINAVVNELASAENGVVVFASSTGKQYSLEDSAWGNGAFTKALVEGIGGRADYTGKGKITINMLDLYLSERVKELTKGKQTPTTTKPQTIQDFLVAMKR